MLKVGTPGKGTFQKLSLLFSFAKPYTVRTETVFRKGCAYAKTTFFPGAQGGGCLSAACGAASLRGLPRASGLGGGADARVCAVLAAGSAAFGGASRAAVLGAGRRVCGVSGGVSLRGAVFSRGRSASDGAGCVHRRMGRQLPERAACGANFRQTRHA